MYRHIGEEQRAQETIAVFANWLNSLGVLGLSFVTCFDEQFEFKRLERHETERETREQTGEQRQHHGANDAQRDSERRVTRFLDRSRCTRHRFASH